MGGIRWCCACAQNQAETFGPVVALCGFDGSEAEAVRLANKTEYGLAAYVYSKDLQKVTSHRRTRRHMCECAAKALAGSCRLTDSSHRRRWQASRVAMGIKAGQVVTAAHRESPMAPCGVFARRHGARSWQADQESCSFCASVPCRGSTTGR